MNRILAVAAFAAGLPWAHAAVAHADPDSTIRSRPPDEACRGPLDAATVVRCSLLASPEVAEARHHLAAMDGRRAAASVWLPSNPTLAGTVARRRRPEDSTTAINWSVSLSQELELGGQRGARTGEAEAEAGAAARRVAIAEQEVAAAALGAFFEASAAQQALQFADELVAASAAVARSAKARAQELQLSGIEADVARAEAVRFGLLRAEAGRRFADATVELALLLGLPAAAPPSKFVGGGLPAPDLSDRARLQRQALQLRGEIGAAAMERRVLEQRLALRQRERVPSVTLSAFAERDEINDRILGVGLSIPLPLPAPVGRTRAGEIAETLAEVRAAESSVQLVQRRVLLEVARALASYEARQEARALFDDDLRARAQADLRAVREAVAAGQLALREAVTWQRSLTELLLADIETRLQRELALLELHRVLGLRLGGAP
jgi:cobalt-zinc-cadmium efflux system outer membrane protein